MSYISVWIAQSLVMYLWMRFVSSTPLSLHELTAGVFFSGAALFTHWACHRAPKGTP